MSPVRKRQAAVSLFAISLLTAAVVVPARGAAPVPEGTFKALTTLDRTLDQMINGLESGEGVPLGHLIGRAFRQKNDLEQGFELGGKGRYDGIENTLTNIDILLDDARGHVGNVQRRVHSLEHALKLSVTLTNQVRQVDDVVGHRSPAEIEADDLLDLVRGVIREARDPHFSEGGLSEEIGAAITQKGKVTAKLPKIFGLRFSAVFLPLENLDVDLLDARDAKTRKEALSALRSARGHKVQLEHLIQNAPGTSEPRLAPLHAQFIRSGSKTVYTERAADPDGRTLYYHYSLTEHNDGDCLEFFGPSRAPAADHIGRNQAVWHHAASDGCSHELEGPMGHQGTIEVVVTDKVFRCTATYDGSQGPNGQLEGDGPKPPPCEPL